MYLRSLDLPSGWTAEELCKFKAYIGENWRTPPEIDEAWRELAKSRPLPEPQPMPAAGHNNPPPDGDPGADSSFRFCLPTPEYVSRDRVRAFEQALQEQGGYGSRLAALDQAAYRVRATRGISHRAFRVHDAILDASRGRHRCCLLDLDKIA